MMKNVYTKTAQILNLIAAGIPSTEIAELLKCSTQTIWEVEKAFPLWRFLKKRKQDMTG